MTAELLRKSGANLTLLRMEPHPLIEDLSHTMGLPMITVRRQLSPTLFDLNKKGALNGHVPITAYLSILSCLLAVVYDYDAVAMSNERSANEGNVEYRGLTVNHQWSKSLEFERMLRRYLESTVKTDVEYFSLLRPLSELNITKLFSEFPQYLTKATSCNYNWKISGSSPAGTIEEGRWCNKCPKCAFVFACLAAFLPLETLTTIFGANLFENEALLPLYRELLGIEKFKPFECVGTVEEVQAAFLLARKRGDLKNSVVMNMFELEVLGRIDNPEAVIDAALAPATQQFIPEPLRHLLA